MHTDSKPMDLMKLKNWSDKCALNTCLVAYSSARMLQLITLNRTPVDEMGEADGTVTSCLQRERINMVCHERGRKGDL